MLHNAHGGYAVMHCCITAAAAVPRACTAPGRHAEATHAAAGLLLIHKIRIERFWLRTKSMPRHQPDP